MVSVINWGLLGAIKKRLYRGCGMVLAQPYIAGLPYISEIWYHSALLAHGLTS